jgi:hypothetical protein
MERFLMESIGPHLRHQWRKVENSQPGAGGH